MNNVLNSAINFDLHIHSKASEYKESPGIVDRSTKENLEVLLSKLHSHNVALFSITDHNRFDPALYLEINRILGEANHPYQNVRGVLAGVEFDVVLDEEMKKCHIIAIFDANNNADKYEKIKAGLGTNLLTDIQRAYSKTEFDNVLKAIGLNTILIASQKKDIRNQSGNHNSLSDSIINVEQIIRVGYINALEFQKPQVEGILLNNLKELSLPITLFSGSDCHDWACYPYHDEKNQNREFYHSKAKILPTFKGLLMAITSPETRFNRSENMNKNVIENLSIGGRGIPLVNGINAIIGENGSGKTTLLKLINGKLSETHVKTLISDNNLATNKNINPQLIKYIEQGQIIKKFNDNTLFSTGGESNFKELDNLPFREAYSIYSNDLKKSIEARIIKQENLSSLSKYIITFKEDMTIKNYYIDIPGNEFFKSLKNPHEKARKNVNDLLYKAIALLNDKYFEQYKSQLERIIEELKSINNDVSHKWSTMDYETNIKNIMHGCTNDYLRKVKEHSPAKEREIKDYNNKKLQMTNAIITAIKTSVEEIRWPNDPPVMKGITKNPKQGFYFNRKAAYNEASMVNKFYTKMFNKAYGSKDSLKNISTNEQYIEAIRNCTAASDINTRWEDNFNKFINEAIKTNDYIMDGADQQIGNTLGEMSLSYYKFFTQDNHDWSILIVDQPEDNISNNNINQKLIGYFNAIRDDKQIIFVTHNPLLVVNLDVDNVIFMENDGGKLTISNGCLEYENESTNILEIIAQNMDGGKETIEKRLKVYGKSN